MHSKVLNITIFDKSNKKVLVCVRNGETFDTHPDVLSTPTQRLPESIFNELLEGVTKTQVQLDKKLNNFPEQFEKCYLLESKSHDRAKDGHSDPYIYSVTSLLGQKLGISEDIFAKDFNFTVTCSSLVYGKVLYENKPLNLNVEKFKGVWYENLAMLNLQVNLLSTVNFPKMTSAYKEIGFIGLDDFDYLVSTREVGGLNLFRNKPNYCVHGMCIASSYIGLNSR